MNLIRNTISDSICMYEVKFWYKNFWVICWLPRKQVIMYHCICKCLKNNPLLKICLFSLIMILKVFSFSFSFFLSLGVIKDVSCKVIMSQVWWELWEDKFSAKNHPFNEFRHLSCIDYWQRKDFENWMLNIPKNNKIQLVLFWMCHPILVTICSGLVNFFWCQSCCLFLPWSLLAIFCYQEVFSFQIVLYYFIDIYTYIYMHIFQSLAVVISCVIRLIFLFDATSKVSYWVAVYTFTL